MSEMSSGYSSGEYSRSASWMIDEVARHLREAPPQRRALAAVALLQDEPEPQALLQAGSSVARAVG